MRTEIKNLSESKIEISFEVPWEQVLPYLDSAASKLSENLKVAGFRSGKIPRKIVEKEIGEAKVLNNGVELLIKEKYPKFVIENKLEVVGQPRIEILKLVPGNPLSFKIQAEVLPQVKLPDFRKIVSQSRKREVSVSVSEKEVENTLNQLQKSKAEFKIQKRGAKKGDFLEIEYQSPQIENNKLYKDSFFLGKGKFIPGFEENLEGMKENEEKEFSLKKDSPEKKVVFKVKVKKNQEVKFPELNNEFARKLGNFESLDELKKSIREGIKKEKEAKEIQRKRAEILEKISSEAKIALPESLVSLEAENMINDLKERVRENLKIPFEEYLSQIKKTEKDLKKSFFEKAKEKVKNFLILREIGKRENIEVKDEEVESAINDFLANFPDTKKAKELDINRLKDYYKGVLYNEKIFKKLENYVTNNSNDN